MTDPHHPDLDDLASAHLDGATSPEEAERVDSDPDLRAQVERLREIQAAIRAEPPVDDARREAAIAAALDAFAAGAPDATTEAVATVTPLAPRRPPSRRERHVLRIAAVVILVALLVPLVLSLGGGSDDEASFDSTGAAIEGTSDGGADDLLESGGEAAPHSGGGTAADGGFSVPDLGTFDDLDSLAAAVAAAPDQRSAVTELSGPPGLVCTPIGSAPSAVFLATVDGQVVEVFVFTEPGGQGDEPLRSAIIRDRETCDELAVRAL